MPGNRPRSKELPQEVAEKLAVARALSLVQILRCADCPQARRDRAAKLLHESANMTEEELARLRDDPGGPPCEVHRHPNHPFARVSLLAQDAFLKMR
jgi:hypothetical protein